MRGNEKRNSLDFRRVCLRVSQVLTFLNTLFGLVLAHSYFATVLIKIGIRSTRKNGGEKEKQREEKEREKGRWRK